MGTEHQTAQQDRRQQQHYRKQPTEREQMKLKSNNHPTIAQNEHWKARQPHLGRTFPEVQTGPTSDRNEAVTPQRVSVETLFLPARYREPKRENDDCNQPIVLLISKGGVFTPQRADDTKIESINACV